MAATGCSHASPSIKISALSQPIPSNFDYFPGQTYYFAGILGGGEGREGREGGINNVTSSVLGFPSGTVNGGCLSRRTENGHYCGAR